MKNPARGVMNAALAGGFWGMVLLAPMLARPLTPLQRAAAAKPGGRRLQRASRKCNNPIMNKDTPFRPSPSGKLRAWIASYCGEEFVAAFVGESAASCREPATRRCHSADEARGWVEAEARAIGLEIDWLN